MLLSVQVVRAFSKVWRIPIQNVDYAQNNTISHSFPYSSN